MRYTREEKIPFTNDFMFSLVMRDAEICIEFLKLILPEEDFVNAKVETNNGESDGSSAEINIQAMLKFAESAKGVRFDVYVRSQNSWATVEMQVYVDYNLPKRSRYYQSNMDIDALNKGRSYSELPRSYVVFICTYDVMNLDYPVYYFESIEKNSGLPFGDETYKIILNTKCSPEKVPERLKPLYEYINNSETESQDEFVKKLDNKVKEYNSGEWRRKLMTLEEIMKVRYNIGLNEGLKKGLSEGRREGLSEGIKKGRAEGRTEGRNEVISEIVFKMKESGIGIDKIAEYTGLTEEEIRKL